MTIQEMAKLGGEASVKKRLGGKTKAEISAQMKLVRRSNSTKTMGIDFDGTICEKQPYGDGTISNKPNAGAQEVISMLKTIGFKIVVFTTRLNPKFGGDIEWKKKQIEDWLNKYEIPFDEVTNNKPEAIAYIDDRAIRFTNWQDIRNYYSQ